MSEEYFQIHVTDTERDFEALCEAEVEVDQMEVSATGETRSLMFSRGGPIEIPDGDPFAIQVDEENNLSRTIVRDYHVGVAYYLHTLETHGVDEEAAIEELSERVDVAPFLEWIESLTVSERQVRLFELLEWRAGDGGDWAAAIYLDDHPCEFRSKELTGSGQTLAEDITRQIDVKPKMCYWTAQHAAMLHADNHRVEYAEGIVLPKQAAQSVRHAWIEIDGEVAEITWPWHYPDGREAIYYGVTVDAETVVETRERRETNGSVLLTDEEVVKLGQGMRPDDDLMDSPALVDYRNQ